MEFVVIFRGHFPFHVTIFTKINKNKEASFSCPLFPYTRNAFSKMIDFTLRLRNSTPEKKSRPVAGH